MEILGKRDLIYTMLSESFRKEKDVDVPRSTWPSIVGMAVLLLDLCSRFAGGFNVEESSSRGRFLTLVQRSMIKNCVRITATARISRSVCGC
jgi:hypothetical protein